MVHLHEFSRIIIFTTGRICYWDLVEERMVESFQAHTGVISGIAMHPRGECLITASTDGSIKVWQ